MSCGRACTSALPIQRPTLPEYGVAILAVRVSELPPPNSTPPVAAVPGKIRRLFAPCSRLFGNGS